MKKSLAKKFSVYSAIGLAGGMTFGSTAAEADIIFTEVNGEATLGNPLSVDMDGDGTNEFVFDLFQTANGYGTNSNILGVVGNDTNDLFVNTDPSPFSGFAYGPNNLAQGDVISGGLSFQQGPGAMQLAYSAYLSSLNFGPFNTASASGYIGVQFDLNGSNVFGWFSVEIEGDATDLSTARILVNSFAYQDNGSPISAGQGIPEPSSIGLLALGAAGLAARRRKNNKV